MPHIQNQSQSLDFNTVFDDFDVGSTDFFDFPNASIDSTSLDIAQTTLHGFPQTIDTTIPLQVQCHNVQACTCTSITFVLELFNRIKELESCVKGLKSPCLDGTIVQRLTLAEARLDDQQKVQTSMQSEISRQHNWIKYYDDQGCMSEVLEGSK